MQRVKQNEGALYLGPNEEDQLATALHTSQGLAGTCRIDCSDGWSDRDLLEYRAYSLKRLDDSAI
jgi:hypothetical protein